MWSKKNSLFRKDAIYGSVWNELKKHKSEIQKEIIAAYGKEDLYFLAKYILNFWWLCFEPHYDFCVKVQNDRHLSLFLLPRGHCKTLIFSIAHTIQCWLNNPSEPIGIGSDSVKRAIKRMRAIKYQFEQNAIFRNLYKNEIFDNPKRESPKWAEDEIILPGHEGRLEASITAFGVGSMPTGSHYSRVKFDDLVTPENSRTAELLKQTKESFGLVRSSILQATGNLQICGTIYDDGDLHRELEDSGSYHVYKRPAEWDENGIKKILWPVQYGKDKLDEIKKDPSVDPYIYSCQYLLDPAPEDDNAFFQLSWFSRYENQDRLLPKQPMNVYAAADLAITEKKESCHTAIAVAGLDQENELYLIHVEFGHWDSLGIIDRLIHIQAKYNPGIFTIEAENIQRAIAPILSMKMREAGIFLNCDYRLPKGDKLTKARPFQARAKEGAIYLPKKGLKQPDWLFQTEYEIRRFPRAKHKDVVDSISLICQQLADQWRPPTNHEMMSGVNDVYVPLDHSVGV